MSTDGGISLCTALPVALLISEALAGPEVNIKLILVGSVARAEPKGQP